MSLGSYILYLRGLKGGITPREVAQEIELPEHFIHAIELEKHGGDITSRTKLAEYFETEVDEFSECSRSTHARFMELLKKERRPQVGFSLMNGETLFGTVDGADSSIVKIVELNTGVKTILQRHAIKRWWPLKKSGFDGRSGRPMGGGANRGPRPGGGGGGFRPGGSSSGGGFRPNPGGSSGGGFRPNPGGSSGGGFRPNPGGSSGGGFRPNPGGSSGGGFRPNPGPGGPGDAPRRPFGESSPRYERPDMGNERESGPAPRPPRGPFME